MSLLARTLLACSSTNCNNTLPDPTTAATATATTTTTTTTDSTTTATVHPILAMHLRQFLPTFLPSPSALTQFNYLRYVRHINHINHTDYKLRREQVYWPTSEPFSSEEEAYRKEHKDDLQRQCQLDDVVVPPYIYVGNWGDNRKDQTFYHLHRVILLREATWALASLILDQLESLTLPLSDIGRYRAVIERFGRLERLCFFQDEIYVSGGRYNYTPSSMRGDAAMQAMVQFVKEHVRLFPGRLKIVTSHTFTWATYICHYFPEGIQLQIYQALPPPSGQALLNKDNYLPTLAHVRTVDLGLVQDIVDWTSNGWLKKVVLAEPRFLQRCRRLRSISLSSLGEGSFDWAVKERRSLDGFDFVTVEGTVDAGDSDDHNDDEGLGLVGLSLKNGGSSLEFHPRQQNRGRLVPLESMYLTESSFDREIDDIAFAFSSTLRSLTVGRPIARNFVTPAGFHRPFLRVGRGWVDMRLRVLDIDAFKFHLMLDPFMFSQCPELVHINLSDSTSSYHCHEIPLSLPAQLNNLEILELRGLPALSFHPATLATTTKLRQLRLTLNHRIQRSFFIPPVEELLSFYGGNGAGPLWTWDWYLPCLTDLRLTNEFAYRFQFRMLQGCPSLQRLKLDMRSNSQTSGHDRILTFADFSSSESITTTTTNNNNNNNNNNTSPTPTRARKQKRPHIFAQSLQFLKLRGPWIIDDSIIPLLLHDIFPHIRDITLKDCSGFSASSIAHALRKRAKHIATVDFSKCPLVIPPSEEEQVRLGLYPYDDYVLSNDIAWHFKIHFKNNKRFFLLRDPDVMCDIRTSRRHLMFM
ncbi:hypothetical protein F5H01DRAFT_403330 [Linnemannia elongata]|nr:hypothetical protein F5H01DRAFT_403330 [Linnemannia elongata]